MTAAAAPSAGFLEGEDEALCRRFLEEGHVVLPVADRGELDLLRGRLAALAAGHLGVPRPAPADAGGFLDAIHTLVDPARLNALRLACIQGLNAEPWLRPLYYRLARPALEVLVGNELAMQRRLNLSIQLPDDAGSLLPVHTDTWSGDSPFEVVVWLPLVDCSGSKSMFLVPPAVDAPIQAGMARLRSAAELDAVIRPHAVELTVPYGSVLVFSQNLMHGNRVNREAESRWSMNGRFKSLMSPYADKALGEFFEPITLRPATRLGMLYQLPEGFS